MNNALMQRVVLSPVLNSQTLTIYRSAGSFVSGRWVVSSKQTLKIQGVAYPSSQQELEQLPEGDRISSSVSFITNEQIYVTHTDSSTVSAGLSDELEWHGSIYKVIGSFPWQDYGHFISMGVRLAGS